MAGEMGNFGQGNTQKNNEKEEVNVHGMIMGDGTVYRTDGVESEEIKDTLDSYEDRQ